MMFKPRSPFGPPQVPTIDKKPKNSMSIEPKQKNQLQYHKAKTSLNSTLQPGLGYITQSDTRFAFDLKEPLANDNSIYWQYQLNNEVTGQYSRKLAFRQQQFYFRGVLASDIVNSISVVIEDLPGYYDINAIQTNVVCSLALCQQIPIIDDFGVKSYDLVYRQSQDVVWDIPMTLTTLSMKLLADGQPLSGDLAIPLNMLFDIRHVGK